MPDKSLFCRSHHYRDDSEESSDDETHEKSKKKELRIPQVSCGLHIAKSCEECGPGESWCHGECQWNEGIGSCIGDFTPKFSIRLLNKFFPFVLGGGRSS